MADFNNCVKFVLQNEGGLSENPRDPGGVTNYGISLRFLRSLSPLVLKRYGLPDGVDDDCVKRLTEDQAYAIYKGEFWDHAPFEKIQNGTLAKYIFDMCVHHGIGNGIRLTQRSTWAANKHYQFVADDGVLGAKTIQAINWSGFMLLPCMMSERASFCRAIGRPEFLEGWLKRCYRI